MTKKNRNRREKTERRRYGNKRERTNRKSSKTLNKRTLNKQKGGAWYSYEGKEFDTSKKTRVSKRIRNDLYSAENIIWKDKKNDWENFLKKNKAEYEQYKKLIGKMPTYSSDSHTSWSYLKNTSYYGKYIPFYKHEQKPYLDRVIFHKYYGEGRIIDYDRTKGWYVQFIAPEFGGDNISKISMNVIEEKTPVEELPGKKYIYTFYSSRISISGGNILVKQNIESSIADILVDYENRLTITDHVANKVVQKLKTYLGTLEKFTTTFKIDKQYFLINKKINVTGDIGEVLKIAESVLETLNIKYPSEIETVSGEWSNTINYLLIINYLEELEEKREYMKWINVFENTFFIPLKQSKSDKKSIGGGRKIKITLSVLFFCLSVIFALAHWVSGGTLLVWLAIILPKGSASTVILTKASAIIAWLKGCIIHFSSLPWWMQWTKANSLSAASISISKLLVKSDESR